MHKNIILETDSYKLTHKDMYQKGTEVVYSYFEARGGYSDYTVFFGLQSIIKEWLVGQVVTQENIDEAREYVGANIGDAPNNLDGWQYIVDEHNGYLPIRIKAVSEGTPVPVHNVLMTVENTDPKCFWLTNALESILTHVWYPTNVATLSRNVKTLIQRAYGDTSDTDDVSLMLQDFGYRGATTPEAAAIGGAGHLVNFLGTDTVPALRLAHEHYNASLEGLGLSVPATEHSIMTSLGREGEYKIVDQLLENYPTGILSVVADSYNIYKFVTEMSTTYKNNIVNRDGVFVIRPDSVTTDHDTPARLMVWIMDALWEAFGGTVNSKGYKVLPPQVRVLWGDGIDYDGISHIIDALKIHAYSIENVACFGMGGGLLQKHNRDTHKFAFKCSAQKRNGEWHDVFKDPIGGTKTSKKGRLKLSVVHPLNEDGELPEHYETRRDDGWYDDDTFLNDILITVFENGKLTNEINFDTIRSNAA